MELIDEPVARLDEALVLVVLHQLDHVATFATDKALVDVLLLVHVHRRMLIVVIPACGTFGDLAHAIERNPELRAYIEDGYLAYFLQI